jgi:hypothetical protein
VTTWVITTAAERLPLDDQRKGTVTLTVTNTSNRPDRVMFEVVTDPAAQSWFTVEEAQRTVAATASTQYRVTATVPDGARAGQYQLQGRVYSLDSAPEETSVLSNRILLDVAGSQPKPPSRLRAWWPVIPAALVVIAVVAVILVVVNRSTIASPAAAGASGSPGPPTVAVPSVVALPDDKAAAALQQAGLVPQVRHKYVPANPGPVTQSIPAGTMVARGSTVEVIYPSVFQAPHVISPAQSATLPRIADPVAAAFGARASSLQVTWVQPEPFITTWVVVILNLVCDQYTTGSNNPLYLLKNYVMSNVTEVSVPSFTAVRYLQDTGTAIFPCGNEAVEVAPVDDFGSIGPYSPAIFYAINGA